MKKVVLLSIAYTLLFSSQLVAQILTPVKLDWKVEAGEKGECKLVFNAKIDPKWHVYSQFVKEGGPIPTSLTFDANKDIQILGKATETGGKVHDGFEEMFGMDVKYFENSMTIVQKVKVLKDTKLTGTLQYMVCDDSRCLPPEDVVFEFELKAGGCVDNGRGEIIPPTNNNTTGIAATDKDTFDSIVQAQIDDSMEPVDTVNTGNIVAGSGNGGPCDLIALANAPADKYGEPVLECGETETADMSLWQIFVLGFLGGLTALLTPCVFPMIPLTVSFFTKRSESKTKGKLEAIFYAFCIVFIYFLISVPYLVSDVSPDTLSELSTGAILNVVFFVVFVFFALSFFGFYEISLPSFIANKADSASNAGGLLGIFFMAVTLAIVSFSCTGPILGTLVVSTLSSAGGKLNFTVGMTAFGLALALPFGVFAMFPNLMKSLPKSGGWLNTVKVTLGFLELIFAFKFLSNADMVAHWGILKREVFLVIWTVLGFGLFFYLIGKLRFPHDSPIKKLSPMRMVFSALAFAFASYSAYGIPGNPLPFFSGFPPPLFYSINKPDIKIETIHNDYCLAIDSAKKVNKPVLIDYTGWACVNCRRMEENVWVDDAVLQRLKEKYIIVSLYVDDKEELPKSQQRISSFFKGKKIKTVGNHFSEMQAKFFESNSQPYYVLVSPDEQLLNKPVGYTPDAKDYLKFLDCGLEAHAALQAKK